MALADFVYEPFAQIEIVRLEEARLAALESRIQADLALGRQAAVVGELKTLIAEHPHREHFRSQLMLALYRAGRPSEALTAYRDTWQTFTSDLGIDPCRARRLEQAILVETPRWTSGCPRDRHFRRLSENGYRLACGPGCRWYRT